MKYPTLKWLRVARRHRRGTPQEPLVVGKTLLEASKQDLNQIERLGKPAKILPNAFCSAQFRERPGKGHAKHQKDACGGDAQHHGCGYAVATAK